MKTAIIWTFLFVALLGTIGYLLSQRSGFTNPFTTEVEKETITQITPTTFDQATIYTCGDGSVVAAAFKTGDITTIEVSLPNSNPIIMTQTEAASGARYAHESGLVFWEKSGIVLVEKDGEVVFADCTAGQLIETTPVATTTSEFSGTQWVWVETDFATASSVEPNEPEDFVITFSENNRFSANTDCNNLGGGYTLQTNNGISFTEMVATLIACDGDVKEGAFTNMLASVVSYQIEGTELVLNIKSDSDTGEMKFTKK